MSYYDVNVKKKKKMCETEMTKVKGYLLLFASLNCWFSSTMGTVSGFLFCHGVPKNRIVHLCEMNSVGD